VCPQNNEINYTIIKAQKVISQLRLAEEEESEKYDYMKVGLKAFKREKGCGKYQIKR
jgi:hypothetical protein